MIKPNTLRSLVLSWLCCASLTALCAPLDEVNHKTIDIWSQGIRLAGDIYSPKNLEPGSKLPGILLVHGWAGTKDHLRRNYGPQFATQGFVVLAFDYKGWGESDGPLFVQKPLPTIDEATSINIEATHIRKIVNPLSMLEDVRAALHYLVAEPNVMADNIGIWGTSLGGGLAMVTATNDERIKAFVDQIGAVNFQSNLEKIPANMFKRWESQRARGEIPSYPGAEAVVSKVLKGFPDWIAMKRYDPYAEVHKLTIPTLIIDAEQEELFPREHNGQKLYADIKDRVEAKYIAYPGGHYDIYRGENYTKALKQAQDWFIKHLKGSAKGAVLYKDNCALCHSNPQAAAPSLSLLKSMSKESVLFAMTQGKMRSQAAGLTDEQREELATFIAADIKDPRLWEQTMACASNAAPHIPETEFGWGYGLKNHRYQTDSIAGMTASDLPDLELAWAMGFPGASEMRSQPVITKDTLFLGVSASSSVYAFDLKSGCLKWTYRGNAPVRSALSLAHLPKSKTAVLFYGDIAGNVHVINAINGEKLWSKAIDFRDATLTGTPVHSNGKLFIPVSTSEITKTFNAQYECCKAHGGVVALDIENGKTLWSYHTAPAAKKVGKTIVGTASWGPSGAPVWTTPAIDIKRNRLYIGTGENYSHPTTNTSDAIIALNLDTGKEAWVYQALAKDAYNMACNSFVGHPDGPNCPKDSGPDFDFGASVIITKTSTGKDILLAGQKSGDVYALDPDNEGKVIWHTKLSDGTPVGGIHWGMSVIKDTLYVPIADPDWKITQWDYQPQPGIAALDIISGKIKWRHHAKRDCEVDLATFNPATNKHSIPWPDCNYYYGFSGAATAIDGAVLAGSLNGTLNAFDINNGKIIWQYETNRTFSTINGVPAHGGSLDNAGPVIAHGHMALQSGYRYISQMPGNVLLVFKKKNP